MHPSVTPAAEQKKKGLGCAVFGWIAFFLALAFVCVVGWKTAEYYGALKRGEIVNLPQFRNAFTSVATLAPAADDVPRSSIELEEAPAIGAEPQDAALTIVEFADFQCPYSKEASTAVRSIAAKHGGTVRVIFRDYPLTDLHPDAREAAIAASCAQEQGKFWAYHDRLFQSSPALGAADLLRFASESGLDTVQFQKCFTEERYAKRVDADTAQAQSLGLAGTPTFFFNGKRVEGAMSQDEMERIIGKFVK
ncbi:MAG: hypothetical protein RLZZ324_271 [Candidatus Parcubacteria bacterium]|jgi:protein-disulfide isomerase